VTARLTDYGNDQPGPGSFDPQQPEGFKPKGDAVFKSTTARLPEDRSQAPPCTAYEVSGGIGSGDMRASAGFRSSSPRLPQEKVTSPAATAYSPASPSGYSGPSSAFTSATARIPEIKEDSPDGGLYYPNATQPVKGGAQSCFISRSSRLPEYKADSPPSTAYDPKLPEGRQTQSAVFRSNTARLPDHKSDAPSATAYNPTVANNGGIYSPFRSTSPRDELTGAEGPACTAYTIDDHTISAKAGRQSGKTSAVYKSESPAAGIYDPASDTISHRTGRGGMSAAYRSNSPRFPSDRNTAPGPGTYEKPVRTKKHDVSVSAFRSTTERISESRSEGPGPGYYEVAQPRRSGKSSSAFVSKSQRFNNGSSSAPAPGTYDAKLVGKAKSPAASMKRSEPRFLATKTSSVPGPGQYRYTYSSFLKTPY